nr:sigma-70 family RNA polymerase sigma factor [Haloactinopolyspora sp.]
MFTRHSKAVYNYCFRLTGSWATAEDLTSVVFLEAWRRREEATSEDGVIVPWLLAVASDVTRHSERAVRRHRRLLAKLPPAVIEGDATREVSDSERQMQQILRIFRRLPRAEQDVLALCVWGGRSYAEAAVALGVPVGTVRSRLARAHAHMRRLTESARPKARLPEPRPWLDT